MMRALFTILILTALLEPMLAVAEEDSPITRISLSADTVRVGEPVTLTVAVLVPSWFPKPPVFPSFEVPNAIVRLPPDSTYPISERIGRATWSGIVRDYQVFPLLPATFMLGGQPLRVTWANPPGEPLIADVPVPGVQLIAEVPAGAENLNPYLAGRSLTLERRIIGETSGLEVGDALEVEYVAELDGLPAMFLPPLVEQVQRPGLAMYPNEPRVEDGDVARRSEKVTLVFELGGGFALPAPRLRWFNTDTETVEVAEVPAMTVDVKGELPPPEAPETGTVGRVLQFLAALLLASLVLWLLRQLIRYRSERRRRWLASEEGAFEALLGALKAGDGQGIDKAFARWLDRTDGSPGPVAFARRWGDSELVTALEAMARSRFGNEGGDWQPLGIEQGLSTARERFLSNNTTAEAMPLPPLNP